MKIILLKQVEKIGKKDDVKNVKSGFARNFLIPQGLAMLATEKTIELMEARKKALQAKIKAEKDKILKMLKKLDGLVINITAKAEGSGKLFAAVSAKDIIDELVKKGFKNILQEHLKLDEVIKKPGKYNAVIDIGLKKKTKIVINVKSKK